MTPSLFSRAHSADEAKERRALVALSLVDGVGPERIRALLAEFGSAAAAITASGNALQYVPGVGPQTAEAIRCFDDWNRVDDQLARAEQVGASLLATWDERFPRLLRQIYDPPAALWMRGRIVESDQRALAIVGTRRATDYGRRLAYDFAGELTRRGCTIVSGLAYGIDAAAHRGAVEAGGRTIAVLGSGIDRIYPSKHTRLAQQIMEQGAVLSEYPLGTAPDAVNFPRRNRIVSGLSLGTLVVESYETGGALITARMALEQNREVFAIPSAVHSKAGVGTNQLIQRGHAKLVLSVDDILDELGFAEAVAIDEDETSNDEPPIPNDLNRVERQLLEVLEAEPIHIDTICTRTDLDASTALVYLLNLEFKGVVRQMAGKQFFRA